MPTKKIKLTAEQLEKIENVPKYLTRRASRSAPSAAMAERASLLICSRFSFMFMMVYISFRYKSSKYDRPWGEKETPAP